MAEVKHCIQHTQVGSEYEGKSLCGRSRDELAFEFHYVGVDHWLNAVLRGSLPQVCKKCTKKLVAIAESGKP